MKILQVVPFVNPGSGLGKYVLSLSTVLVGSGHEVGVITTHTSDAVYERKQLVKCDAACVGQLGGLSKLKMYWRLMRLINNYAPDVLIVNYDGSAQFILPFVSRMIKVVHVLHNNTDDFYRVGSINACHVDGWIAPTKAIADRFDEYTGGKYSSKVAVIPHGVESANIKSADDSQIVELIFVGVHYEHKGVKILPDIIKRLVSFGLDFHFTIVGKGELTNWLKEALREQSEVGIVTFTGVISADEVYVYQSKADIFVYPTHIDAFGLVIAEAMINSTVPVVTDLKGITDNLIENGENGFLIPQDDVDEFVDKIAHLINNRSLLRQMKNNARKAASEKFSLARMACNYNNYLKLLS